MCSLLNVTRNLRPPPIETLILYYTIAHIAAVLGPLACPSRNAQNCIKLIQPNHTKTIPYV